MPETVYATFPTAILCEQAAGALLDYGVRKEDISLVAHESLREHGTVPVTHGSSAVAAANDPLAPITTNAQPSADAGSYSDAPPVAANNTRLGDTMGRDATLGIGSAGNQAPYSSDAMGGETRSSNAERTFQSAEAHRETVTRPTYVGQGLVGTGAVPESGYTASAAEANDVASTEALYDARAHVSRVTGTTETAATPPGVSAADSMSYDPTDETISRPRIIVDEYATSDKAPAIDQSHARHDVEFSPDIEGAAKQTISVTTPADAAAGAAKGAGWGLGLGILAGIAALAVPGVGWVVGGGALATAIAGAIGTTVAGGVAGGAVGYLKDQGVPEHAAATYNQTVTGGGAVLSVHAPSHNVDAATIEQIARKYGATQVDAY